MSPCDLLDQSKPVRPGGELDAGKLEAFLRERLPDLAGPLVIEQFPKGYSNLTYLIRAGEREMVLRRPPFGAKIKSAHDMGREYRILSRICSVYPKVPRPLAYCEDESVLGAPFYVMERVSGIILRAKAPAGLELTPSFMEQLSESFVQNLAELHGLDYAGAGLGDLGRPEGYVGRQIEGWQKRYVNALTDDVPEMGRAGNWLAEHQPKESGAALIHNDYKYDNLVLDAAEMVASGCTLRPTLPPHPGPLPLGGGEGESLAVFRSTPSPALAGDHTAIPPLPKGEGRGEGEETTRHISRRQMQHDPSLVTRHSSLIKAVLDWEMATVGDPLMDVGCSLGYWVDADDPDDWREQSLGLTALPGNLNREQLLERYRKLSGREIHEPVFYYVYGLLRIAVIVQQIYFRYKQGHTKDERFASLIDMVRAASRTAGLAIEKGRISSLNS